MIASAVRRSGVSSVRSPTTASISCRSAVASKRVWIRARRSRDRRNTRGASSRYIAFSVGGRKAERERGGDDRAGRRAADQVETVGKPHRRALMRGEQRLDPLEKGDRDHPAHAAAIEGEDCLAGFGAGAHWSNHPGRSRSGSIPHVTIEAQYHRPLRAPAGSGDRELSPPVRRPESLPARPG